MPAKACILRYPIREKVAIQFKVVNVIVGRFSLEFPFLVAKISDEYILRVDFLRMV